MKIGWITTEDSSWIVPFIISVFIGFLPLILYAIFRSDPWSAVGIGLLISGAALATGIIIGFLFGIPRTVQQEGQKPDAVINGLEGNGSEYRVNTNLEQISDWLTKILVGLGLVQLTKIPPKFSQLADYLASSFSPPAPSSIISVVILYFGIGGFLIGYLCTRLFLTLEFSRADRAAHNTAEYYEGLIHALLYQPAPDGFERAIKQGEGYLRHFGETNYRVWEYLACAYAQQYAFLDKGPTRDQETLKKIKEKVLEAVDKVLQLNPSGKGLLKSLWDPSSAIPLESDLTIFANDEDFKRRLA